MSKHRTHPTNERPKKILARRVMKIQYANREAIIASVEENGPITIFSTEQTEGPKISTNAQTIEKHIVFRPPFPHPEDLTYLAKECEPVYGRVFV